MSILLAVFSLRVEKPPGLSGYLVLTAAHCCMPTPLTLGRGPCVVVLWCCGVVVLAPCWLGPDAPNDTNFPAADVGVPPPLRTPSPPGYYSLLRFPRDEVRRETRATSWSLDQAKRERSATESQPAVERDNDRLVGARGAEPRYLSPATKMMVAARPERAAQTTPLLRVSMLLLAAAAVAGASTAANVMPMAFAGGDLVANLKEVGEAPVRTVSCVGAQGSGKSTLMKTMFGQGASNLALLEARSSAAFVPETDEVEVGAGQAMVSLAVSDATIYNVLVHDLRRPDAMSDVQVSKTSNGGIMPNSTAHKQQGCVREHQQPGMSEQGFSRCRVSALRGWGVEGKSDPALGVFAAYHCSAYCCSLQTCVARVFMLHTARPFSLPTTRGPLN